MGCIETARSNYFRVNDEVAFLAWVTELPGVSSARHEGGFGGAAQFALLAESGWPTTRYDESSGEDIDVCVAEELIPFLHEGDVAVLQTVGHEGMRYVLGYSEAVCSDGAVARVALDDIYAKVGMTRGGKTRRTTKATY